MAQTVELIAQTVGEEWAMLSLQVTVTKAGERLNSRRFADQVRAALHVAARVWNDEFLPKHFQPGASQRYAYAARAKSTLARKRAQAVRGRENLPLVHHGDYKRAAMTPLAQKKVTAQATPRKQKVRVRVHVPHRMRVKNQGEGTRLVTVELRTMQRAAALDLRERLKADMRTPSGRRVYGRR